MTIPLAHSHLPCLPSSLQPLRPSLFSFLQSRSPRLVILLYLLSHGHQGPLSSSYLSFAAFDVTDYICSFEFHDTFWSWFSSAFLTGLSRFLGQLLFPLLPTKLRFCPCLTLPGQSHPYLWPPLISAQGILHSDRCPGFKTSSKHLLGVAAGTALWCPALSMGGRERESTVLKSMGSDASLSEYESWLDHLLTSCETLSKFPKLPEPSSSSIELRC